MVRDEVRGHDQHRIVMTDSDSETREAGRELAKKLTEGDCVGIAGPLGAGKTVLVRGICEGLGVTEEAVTSPSFAIVNTYLGKVRVFHVDLYRVSDMDEVEATGLPDLAETGVVLIEWIDKVPELVDPRMIRVDIDDLGGCRRRLTFRRPADG